MQYNGANAVRSFNVYILEYLALFWALERLYSMKQIKVSVLTELVFYVGRQTNVINKYIL